MSRDESLVYSSSKKIGTSERSLFFSVSLKLSVVNLDGFFHQGRERSRPIIFGQFIFDRIFEAIIKGITKSSIIPFKKWDNLLEGDRIRRSWGSLMKWAKLSFCCSFGINITKGRFKWSDKGFVVDDNCRRTVWILLSEIGFKPVKCRVPEEGYSKHDFIGVWGEVIWLKCKVDS